VIAGNMNKAVAMGTLMRLQGLEIAFKRGRRDFSKEEKEGRLAEIRDLRQVLALPPLPDYNSEAFVKWFGKES
jgi:hypothetical protein